MNPMKWRCAFFTLLLLIGAFGEAVAAETAPFVDEILAPQYFAIYVQEVDKSVAWYCAAFGLEKLGGSAAANGAWRIENVGNGQLLVEIIFDRRAQAADRALGFRKVGFAVADVGEVAARIKAETGEEYEVVEFEELNQRILQLKDPDGNTVQLFSPLNNP